VNSPQHGSVGRAKAAEASLVGMIGISPRPRGEKPNSSFTPSRVGTAALALCINRSSRAAFAHPTHSHPTHCIEIIAFIAPPCS
jgi:hypothetical protein